MARSCIEEIKLKAADLKSFMKEVQKHGKILSLNELYAHEQTESDEIIVGIVDHVSNMIKKPDRQLLVICLHEVSVDCSKGKRFSLYAFNEFAISLSCAKVQNGDFAAFCSAFIEENTRYRIEDGCHDLQARMGIPTRNEAKIFFMRKPITKNSSSKIPSSTRVSSADILGGCSSSSIRALPLRLRDKDPVPRHLCTSSASSLVEEDHQVDNQTDPVYSSARSSPVPQSSCRSSPTPSAISSIVTTFTSISARVSPVQSTSSYRMPTIGNVSSRVPPIPVDLMPPPSSLDGRTLISRSSRIMYEYKTISELVRPEKKVNIYGVISCITKMPSESNKHAIVRLKDETCTQDQEFRVHIFLKHDNSFPKMTHGHILRLHRMKTELYDDELDGRVFRSSDIVTFPPEGQGQENCFSTAVSFHFCDSDARRLTALRNWLTSTRVPSPTPLSTPVICSPTRTVTPDLQSSSRRNISTSSEATTILNCSVRKRSTSKPIKTLLSEVKKEGNYTLYCKVLSVDVLSDKMLILTVTDGTVCSYSVHNSRTGDLRHSSRNVRIIVMDPPPELKITKEDDFVKLTNVKVQMAVVPDSRYKGPLLTFKMTGAECSVRFLEGLGEKSMDLKRRLQDLETEPVEPLPDSVDSFMKNVASSQSCQTQLPEAAAFSAPSTSSAFNNLAIQERLQNECCEERKSTFENERTQESVSKSGRSLTKKRTAHHVDKRSGNRQKIQKLMNDTLDMSSTAELIFSDSDSGDTAVSLQKQADIRKRDHSKWLSSIGQSIQTSGVSKRGVGVHLKSPESNEKHVTNKSLSMADKHVDNSALSSRTHVGESDVMSSTSSKNTAFVPLKVQNTSEFPVVSKNGSAFSTPSSKKQLKTPARPSSVRRSNSVPTLLSECGEQNTSKSVTSISGKLQALLSVKNALFSSEQHSSKCSTQLQEEGNSSSISKQQTSVPIRSNLSGESTAQHSTTDVTTVQQEENIESAREQLISVSGTLSSESTEQHNSVSLTSKENVDSASKQTSTSVGNKLSSLECTEQRSCNSSSPIQEGGNGVSTYKKQTSIEQLDENLSVPLKRIQRSTTLTLLSNDLPRTPQKLQRSITLPLSPPNKYVTLNGKRDFNEVLKNINVMVVQKHCTTGNAQNSPSKLQALNQDAKNQRISDNSENISAHGQLPSSDDSIDRAIRKIHETRIEHSAATLDCTRLGTPTPEMLGVLCRLTGDATAECTPKISLTSTLDKEVETITNKSSSIKNSGCSTSDDTPFKIVPLNLLEGSENDICELQLVTQNNGKPLAEEHTQVVESQGISNVEWSTYNSHAVQLEQIVDKELVCEQGAQVTTQISSELHVENEQCTHVDDCLGFPEQDKNQCNSSSIPVNMEDDYSVSQILLQLEDDNTSQAGPQILNDASKTENEEHQEKDTILPTTQQNLLIRNNLHDNNTPGTSQVVVDSYSQFATGVEISGTQHTEQSNGNQELHKDVELNNGVPAESDAVLKGVVDNAISSDKFHSLTQPSLTESAMTLSTRAETIIFQDVTSETSSQSFHNSASFFRKEQNCSFEGGGSESEVCDDLEGVRNSVLNSTCLSESEIIESAAVAKKPTAEDDEVFASVIKPTPEMIPANISFIKRKRCKNKQDVFILKAWLFDVEPPINKDVSSTDLISGYCSECVCIRSYEDIMVLPEMDKMLCKACFEQGKEKPVKLTFMIRLHLVDENDDELVATVCDSHGPELLGCTLNAYLLDSVVRDRVRQTLSQLTLRNKNVPLKERGPLLKLLIVPVRTSRGAEYLVTNTYILSQQNAERTLETTT